VYTPKDSIAFGGNFLHAYNFETQLKIHGIEENLREPLKYRFPYFEELMWYVTPNKAKITTWERKGLTELAEWLKFYRRKRPATLSPSQFIIDTLHCYLRGEPLPSRVNYQEDDDGGDDGDDEDNESCVCNGKADDELWVGCAACGGWYHASCVGLSKEKVQELENYYCPRCVKSTPSNSTSNLRKTNNSLQKRRKMEDFVEEKRPKRTRPKPV